jgi:two-component system response regulator YesN
MSRIIPFQPRSPHILIVDDEFWVVDVLVDYVKLMLGYDAYGVYSADEAIAHINEHRLVDLVVTDIHMFGMDGLELTEVLSQHWNIKVIVMTGIRYQAARKEAIHAGAVDFFRKPINLQKLGEMIEAALA